MQLVKCKHFASQRGSLEEKYPLTQGRINHHYARLDPWFTKLPMRVTKAQHNADFWVLIHKNDLYVSIITSRVTFTINSSCLFSPTLEFQ